MLVHGDITKADKKRMLISAETIMLSQDYRYTCMHATNVLIYHVFLQQSFFCTFDNNDNHYSAQLQTILYDFISDFIYFSACVLIVSDYTHCETVSVV